MTMIHVRNLKTLTYSIDKPKHEKYKKFGDGKDLFCNKLLHKTNIVSAFCYQNSFTRYFELHYNVDSKVLQRKEINIPKSLKMMHLSLY